MKQQYTILFDLDGTLVDTAPDLMNAHNHVMKKYGFKPLRAEWWHFTLHNEPFPNKYFNFKII